jgi:hypothetical protein
MKSTGNHNGIFQHTHIPLIFNDFCHGFRSFHPLDRLVFLNIDLTVIEGRVVVFVCGVKALIREIRGQHVSSTITHPVGVLG